MFPDNLAPSSQIAQWDASGVEPDGPKARSRLGGCGYVGDVTGFSD